MTTLPAPPVPPLHRRRNAIVPSAVLGALIFVAVEVMFFSGIMSALTISRAGTAPGMWPPPGQPSLAAGAGDVSTAIVLASGALLVGARRYLARDARTSRHLLLAAVLLGLAFIVLQAKHASQLVASGLTITSSQQASFFFLAGGLYSVHAAATLVALFVAWRRLGRAALTPGFFGAVQVFWYFVVLIWPVIYARTHV